MAIYLGNDKIKHINIGDSKIRRVYLGNTKIWSGASKVTYSVDGADTVIEVDEGLDVLHPPLTVEKSDYTHVGWLYNGNRVTELVANGEPMTITAVFIPTNLVVYSATGTGGGWIHITETLRNSTYIYGNPICEASGYNTWGGGQDQSKEKTTSFSILTLGEYTSVTVRASTIAGSTANYPSFKYNGSNTGGGTYTYTQPTSISLYVISWAAMGSWASAGIYASNITLSNPKKWE